MPAGSFGTIRPHTRHLHLPLWEEDGRGVPPHRSTNDRNLPTQEARIAEDFATLAEITEPGRPYTRRAFTPDVPPRSRVAGPALRSAGLETRVDASANLIGRRRGRAGGQTIMLGSHSDTVTDGGRFERYRRSITARARGGAVARALHDQGVVLEHDLEIVDFLAEEVSIFGVSCVGSRGMAGVRPEFWLDREVDQFTLRRGSPRSAAIPEKSRSARISPPSSNCISSRGRCWRMAISLSAW